MQILRSRMPPKSRNGSQLQHMVQEWAMQRMPIPTLQHTKASSAVASMQVHSYMQCGDYEGFGLTCITITACCTPKNHDSRGDRMTPFIRCQRRQVVCDTVGPSYKPEYTDHPAANVMIQASVKVSLQAGSSERCRVSGVVALVP